MKQLFVSSIISLTLLNSGISFAPHTSNNVSDYGNAELKQIITISDYNPKPLDLGVSKISSNLEKIQQNEARKIEDQRKLEEENRLREEQAQKELAEKQKQEAEEVARQKAAAQLAALKAQQAKPVAVAASGDWEGYIKQMCDKYKCNSTQLIRVMYCESGGRTNAYNPSGASGLMQFMPGTFSANANRVGISNPDIWNGYHQIEVAAYMFANGQAGQWSCK
jgi:soluble lytic murein transglycosylase-like protein